MLDGETVITDLDQTDFNSELVTTFVQQVRVWKRYDQLETFIDQNLIQHDPETADGRAVLQVLFEAQLADVTPQIAYRRVHRILAEGNFVLCMSEGSRDGLHAGLYELFRIADGKIAEHWNTVPTIAPRSKCKNDNGKF